jgi:hypothetical protein
MRKVTRYTWSADELPVLPPELLPIAALALVSPSVAALLDWGTTSMAATVAFGVVLIAPALLLIPLLMPSVEALWPFVVLEPEDPELS